MAQGIGTGFGKTILFGEHFVVYGYPALVAGLNHYTMVTIERSSDAQHHLIDKQPRFPGVPLLTWERCNQPILAMLVHANITDFLTITMHGTLPIAHSGIGSSAAMMVAFARALNLFYNFGWNDNKINDLAFIGEQQVHGKASGIDNTAATYGGIFWFNTAQTVPIKLPSPLHIVLAESGQGTPTKEVIAAVAELKKSKPDFVQKIFDEYKSVAFDASLALKNFDLPALGKLMNKNHELLQALTISCDVLDTMVEIARKNGALGAKLTGTGRGGLMLALTTNDKDQDGVVAALEAAGFPCLRTTIG